MTIFAGPAPNQYTLPPVVGYQKHDITKTRMPAFTLGQRTPPPPMIFPWEQRTTGNKEVTDFWSQHRNAPIVVNCPGHQCQVVERVAPCSGGEECQPIDEKKKMPKYKVVYFDIIGLAEPIRMLLSYMGADWEDHRFKREEWPEIKPTTPFGQVPLLEVDGKKVNQSTAISRYLGKEAGLGGANNWEDLQIDLIVDTFHDFRKHVGDYSYDPDEASKAKKKEVLFKETMPFFMKKFNEHVGEHGGYMANGKLSWGDIYIIAISGYMCLALGMDMFADYPNLKALREKVHALPKIKAWLDKRPKTDL